MTVGNLQSYWTTTKLWKLTVVLDYYEAMETYSRIGIIDVPFFVENNTNIGKGIDKQPRQPVQKENFKKQMWMSYDHNSYMIINLSFVWNRLTSGIF